MKKGEEFKVLYYASAAAVCDGNLPYIIATCLYSQQLLYVITLFLFTINCICVYLCVVYVYACGCACRCV